MGLIDLFRKKDADDVGKELESIHKQGLHTVQDIRDEILQKTAIPCMTMELTDTNPSIFDNKVGGLGYVPHNEPIPQTNEGKQLRLLAQVDCSQITLEDFPHKGLLQFWILNDDVWGLNFDEPTKQDTFRVLYHPEVDRTVTEEEVQAKVQEQLSEEEDYFPVLGNYGLQLTKKMDTISESDYRFEKQITELVKQSYPEEAVDLLDDPFEFANEEEGNGFGHKIGGYPGFTQWDPRDESNDHDILLFQLDSDFGDGGDKIMWGDAGICNFFIRRENLKRCDFSDVLYHWDCC